MAVSVAVKELLSLAQSFAIYYVHFTSKVPQRELAFQGSLPRLLVLASVAKSRMPDPAASDTKEQLESEVSEFHPIFPASCLRLRPPTRSFKPADAN